MIRFEDAMPRENMINMRLTAISEREIIWK